MIIWSGWGFLVGVIGFACFLLTEIAVEAALQDDQFYQDHGWPKLVGFVVAAAIICPLGRAFNRNEPAREPLDPGRGACMERPSRREHSLFFIPMEFWAVLFVVIGVMFLFVD